MIRKFTKHELTIYNGQKGMPAYISYEGYIFDVSDSYHWRDGYHQVFHFAGEDLTDALRSAPHGPEFLKRYPMIGYLET
jgi:predicted heme/steroid binding protein